MKSFYLIYSERVILQTAFAKSGSMVKIGRDATLQALEGFDGLYPQPNGQSARQQLQIQLANPMPYDLDETNLAEYKKLKVEYQDWNSVSAKCREIANALW